MDKNRWRANAGCGKSTYLRQTALITIMAPERGHKRHVQNAWAGSKDDALLAQNMAANFAR